MHIKLTYLLPLNSLEFNGEIGKVASVVPKHIYLQDETGEEFVKLVEFYFHLKSVRFNRGLTYYGQKVTRGKEGSLKRWLRFE